MQHERGYVDPQRLKFSRLLIGAACGSFAGRFGNPASVLRQMPPYYTAQVIKFPQRRSDIAKLTAEIAEMSRIVSAR